MFGENRDFLSVVVIGLLSIPFLLLLVYYIISETKNILAKRRNNSIALRDIQFTIRYDVSHNTYSFFYRNNDLNPSFTYKEERFLNVFNSEKAIREWKNYIEKCLLDVEDNKRKITIDIPRFGTKEQSLIDVTKAYYDKDKKQLFLSADSKIKGSVSRPSGELGDEAFNYRNRLNAINKINRIPKGFVAIIDFGNYNTIKTRYGPNVLKEYMTKLWEVFADYNSTKIISGIYRFDSFMLYDTEVNDVRDAKSYLTRILARIGQNLELGGISISLASKATYSVVGEFSNSVDSILKALYDGLKTTAENEVDHYEGALNGQTEKLWKAINLRNALRREELKPIYIPIIDLKNGKEVATFADIDFANSEFKSFTEANKIAFSNGFEEELIKGMLGILQKNFNVIEENKKIKMLIPCRSKSLDDINEIYAIKKKQVNKDQIVLFIKDYDELIAKNNYLEDCESIAKIKNAKLAIMADAKMETNLHSILSHFDYVVWPENIISQILLDEKIAYQFRNIYENISSRYPNIKHIARGVESYAQAAYLKDFEIMLMSGAFFNKDAKSNKSYSVREIAKLIGDFDEQ